MDCVTCRTPTPVKEGFARVPAWKFNILQSAVLSAAKDSDAPFSELKEAVRAHLQQDDLDRAGALGWHVTTVKLEMETRGDIECIHAARPQRIRRVS